MLFYTYGNYSVDLLALDVYNICSGLFKAYNKNHISKVLLKKYYEKYWNDMKPQRSTEECSVFSKRMSYNGNNRGFVTCL